MCGARFRVSTQLAVSRCSPSARGVSFRRVHPKIYGRRGGLGIQEDYGYTNATAVKPGDVLIG